MPTKPKKGLTLKHVNHVVYAVKDLQRAAHFYRDILGIKEIPKQVTNTNLIWLQLPSGVMVHLIESPNAPSPDPVHVAFEVDDIDAAMSELEALKITIESKGTRLDGQRYLFMRDPDGGRVELCTRSGF